MSPIELSFIIFACILCGALLGMVLRNMLPGHHLSPDAKDVIRLGAGLIGTISALVLGLLIASSKSTSADARETTGLLDRLDRAGFGSLFLTAMLTIGIIGATYICFLAQ